MFGRGQVLSFLLLELEADLVSGFGGLVDVFYHYFAGLEGRFAETLLEKI